MIHYKKILLILVVFVSLIIFAGCGGEEDEESLNKPIIFINLATGSVDGLYHSAGGFIADVVNAKTVDYGIKIYLEPSLSSEKNITNLLSGDIDFAIVDSDSLYESAIVNKRDDLKVVFSMFAEPIILVVPAKSRINTVKDLKGKRVNVGEKGSVCRDKALKILRAFGLSEKDIRLKSYKTADAPEMLQNEIVDAFFYTLGEGGYSLHSAVKGVYRVRIIDLGGAELNSLIKDYPYYTTVKLKKNGYLKKLMKGDVETLASLSTLVTRKDMNENAVYAVSKEVLINFKKFDYEDRKYIQYNKSDMMYDMGIQFHKGAIKFLNEPYEKD